MVSEPEQGVLSELLGSIRAHSRSTILPLFLFCLTWKFYPHPSIGTFASVLPPVVTVYFALLTKNVYLSLFAGVFSGSFLLMEGAFIQGVRDAFRKMLAVLIGDPLNLSFEALPLDNLKIIAFAYLLGGMIMICTANGGMEGLMNVFSRFAKSRKRAQFSTWLMGLIVFFDDYTNCLLVGNTMRPITDRFKISREKLSYIVDSTAAPIATIAPVSTWVGYELGLLGSALEKYPALGEWNAFSLFLNSIPFSYYAFFSLFFIGLLIFWGIEFGPMFHAETASTSKESDPSAFHAQTSSHWLHAVGPVLMVILATLLMLYLTGRQTMIAQDLDVTRSGLASILISGNSSTSLFTGALLGCVLAILISVQSGCLSARDCFACLREGGKKMLAPTLVLCLSWSLGSVCHELKTGDFVSLMVQQHLPDFWLPILVFLTSALISFATGTSWGCMAIMVPVVLGITAIHSPQNLHLLLGCVSAILGGASFGDHCSPISDTTVLSSMAAQVDHLSHVRTQIPYACFVGVCVVFAYSLNSLFNSGPWPGLIGGLILLVGATRLIGRRVG